MPEPAHTTNPHVEVARETARRTLAVLRGDSPAGYCCPAGYLPPMLYKSTEHWTGSVVLATERATEFARDRKATAPMWVVLSKGRLSIFDEPGRLHWFGPERDVAGNDLLVIGVNPDLSEVLLPGAKAVGVPLVAEAAS